MVQKQYLVYHDVNISSTEIGMSFAVGPETVLPTRALGSDLGQTRRFNSCGR
jgi:hypothetical protein